MLDCHVHSAFSMDADSSMDEYCMCALETGVDEVVFTDHLDIYYPHDDFSAVLDIDKYSAALKRIQSKFPSLTIRRGIEAGYHPLAVNETHRIIEQLRPDFVINSVHVVGDCDPYYLKYFTGKSRKQAYTEYMQCVLNSLDTPYPYSVVGHIGYVAKRAPYPYPAILTADYSQLIDTILYKIIYSGHGIELNVSSLRSTNEAMPSYSILKRYRELGGEIITYGSDAHNVKDYFSNSDYARDMLTSAGFKYVCTFKRMVPSFVPI